MLYADIDFVRDVKPILEHNCVSCHRADKAEGDIRFDDKESVFSAEDLIVPGKPNEFDPLNTTLPTDDDIFMPPIKDADRDYPLTVPEKKILKDWITSGADWPDEEVLTPQKRLLRPFHLQNTYSHFKLNCSMSL